MKEKFEVKAGNWISFIYQAILLCIVIFNIIFWPVRAWIHVKDVEAKITLIQKEYEKHCIEQKDKMSKLASVEIVNLHLAKIADDIETLKNSMIKYQQTNDEFRNKFYEFLGEMKKGP